MKSYSNPLQLTYSFGNLNFVSGAGAYKIKPPKRCTAGRVEEIAVMVTTTFTQVTTPAYVRIGTASDNDKYAEMNMGAAAANAAYNLQDDTDAIISNINLSGDGVSEIQVTVVAPTGGSPAGVGYLNIGISWWS